MLIKCTMREGITEADIEGYRYTFRPDAAGNPLCNVTKEGHIRQFLNMGPHWESILLSGFIQGISCRNTMRRFG